MMEQLVDSIDCEIYDVVLDGNCFFWFVVDQFRMNGEFYWIVNILCYKVVEYLCYNFIYEDGIYLVMFLLNEVWDEYLVRMFWDKEWGDQFIFW